jgi:predicted nucleic acid-binding Zn ribbon protein
MAYQRRTIKPAKPTRVAEVLEGYLRAAGLAQRIGLAAVVDAWPELVGPRIARAAVAESVGADGTLFVRVPSSAWRQELSLMAPEILALVNRGRKEGRIARIRWLVGEERQGPEDQTPRGRGGKPYGRTGARTYGDGRKGPGPGTGGA